MSDDKTFLSRWSQRKVAARAGKPAAPEERPVAPAEPDIRAKAGIQPEAPAPLPPIDSLSIDSDFSAFMKPGVDPALRREALKVLLRDPRFNVMDGLDVYIDDYSKPDPLPEEWLAKLNQMKHLGHYQEPPPEAEKSLRETMPEQPVGSETCGDASDTERSDSTEAPVTEGEKSGGTLPRNEA